MEELTKTSVDWKKTTVVIALVLLTGLTVGGGAWYYADSGAESEIEAYKNQIATLETKVAQLEADQAADTTTPVATLPSNIFDLSTVKVGDKVGPFTVKSVGKVDPDAPYSATNANIEFTGTATVSGNYEYDPMSIDPGTIRFIPGAASEKFIPTAQKDYYLFGFLADKKTTTALGINESKASKGNVTIVISGYTYYTGFTEGTPNTTTLVSVK